MFFTRQYTFSNGAIGLQALNTANTKCGLDFVQAIALGIMCNALVCLAVWLTFSARTTTDKILAIIPPITALWPPDLSTASPICTSFRWAWPSSMAIRRFMPRP